VDAQQPDADYPHQDSDVNVDTTTPASSTSAKPSAAKLLHGEERFRLLVETATDYAIFFMDASGYIIDWNIGLSVF
jgi:hypothetical protein